MGYLYNDNSDSSVGSTDDTFTNHVVWDTFIMTTVTQVLDVHIYETGIRHVVWDTFIMTTVTLLSASYHTKPNGHNPCVASLGSPKRYSLLWIVSARFIDASMYRDTFHTIRIAIQLAKIAIPCTSPKEQATQQ